MSNPQQGQDRRIVSRHRKAIGAKIKRLRQEQGLTQRQLAELVGLQYYTFVTQIEAGKGRIPPSAIPDWAFALKVNPVYLAWECLRHYDPDTYKILSVDRQRHDERDAFASKVSPKQDGEL